MDGFDHAEAQRPKPEPVIVFKGVTTAGSTPLDDPSFPSELFEKMERSHKPIDRYEYL